MAPEYPLEQCVRPTNVGLPGEEYTLRKERHNARLHHTHLEDVYARHSLGMQGPMRRGQLDAWGPNPELPYRKPVGTATAGKLPTTKHADHALRQSEVANATRRALGRSWHPTDHLDDGLEKYAVPRVSSDWHEVPQRRDPIPDKYLREFNRLWYEDDEDNDADQLVADLTPNAYAPWRTHLPLRPMYCPDAEFRTSTHYWDKTEITNWSKASFKASGTHREVVEPGPLNQTESQGCVRWSDLTLAHHRRKKHSRASSHWKRLTKGFQHSHRA
ncbi:hypothetical protein PMIN01_03191 [Paraphaeosphaeria minitans]|uniref:Uncharacterized protein n=1 Tax=Paraphaeosphaeria minitans TaxID=565426 RepID=A0A9P6GMP8_9PLEO|nr:hypothetical protein PMIN01_03191 [Paraphaeosphaeria minitans]